MMSNDTDNWNPGFLTLSPLYAPLQNVAAEFSNWSQWPALADYQRLLHARAGTVSSAGGAAIHFVAQDGKAVQFADHYEPRIYLCGEVQTRCENWHDFFQVLVWCLFPQTKVQLNALHYDAARQRFAAQPPQPNRSPVENAVTLFDECGAIVVSSDDSLLGLIHQHRWKELFWQQRNTVQQHLRCIVFGHALYEKALNPYPGMTAHALLLPVQTDFHELTADRQIRFLDNVLSETFAQPREQITTGLFSPFPVLGMPGWYAGNDNAGFYDNRDYFRPKNKPDKK